MKGLQYTMAGFVAGALCARDLTLWTDGAASMRLVFDLETGDVSVVTTAVDGAELSHHLVCTHIGQLDKQSPGLLMVACCAVAIALAQEMRGASFDWFSEVVH